MGKFLPTVSNLQVVVFRIQGNNANEIFKVFIRFWQGTMIPLF